MSRHSDTYITFKPGRSYSCNQHTALQTNLQQPDMQNIRLLTFCVWGTLHTGARPRPSPPFPPDPPPLAPAQPPPQQTHQPHPATTPIQPTQPAPWQNQQWSPNEQPTQLAWTATHSTPNGYITSWGGWSTHGTQPGGSTPTTGLLPAPCLPDRHRGLCAAHANAATTNPHCNHKL